MMLLDDGDLYLFCKQEMRKRERIISPCSLGLRRIWYVLLASDVPC